MRFIWTKLAVATHAKGGSDPRHTISAPNIGEIYDGYVRQLRPGTPWILVTPTAPLSRKGQHERTVAQPL